MLEMPVHEVVARGRQEASKWLTRLADGNRPVTLPARGATALQDHVRERVSTQFFEGAATAEATARRIERIADSGQRIISIADAICRGRFDLLGYRGLDFGDPVDWHLDPISGRRAPLVHWSRLDPFDRALLGDCKVVWELNRHQWLLHLGQAYRLTGDERYAEVFVRQVQAWMQANPAGMGINWASSLEVAFRLISWCWALALFEGSQALSAELLAKVVAGIGDHARHVERYLSHYFSPNTHLTGEALGLFYAGVLFPDASRARRWRVRGAEILATQCERQVLPDGVYFEQSTCYQRYTAEIYLHFLILAARSGIGVPNLVAHRLQRLLDFLVTIRRPDGSMPLVGDADGGWLLPLTPRAPDDVRGVFSVAAAFFGRSDYAWAAGGLAPEAVWLLGSSGATVAEVLTQTPPPAMPSQIFSNGGYAIMRSGWERDAHQLVFDVGPLGCPISGGHGHADLLSIQCSVFGEPYLVDPGMYCYAVHPEWRDFFRSTAAHSTIRVDGQEQAVPSGPFKWQARPRGRLRRWHSTETFDLAAAEHDAYGRLRSAVRHRRSVVFVKPRYWVVVDDLEGITEHRVELAFQFAPRKVTLDTDLWVRARGRAGRGLLLRSFALTPLEAELHEGKIAPIQGWVSDDYGQRRPAPVVVFSASTQLPLRVMTIVLPTTNVLAPAPAVSPLLDDTGGLAGLALPGGWVRVASGDDDGIEVGPPD